MPRRSLIARFTLIEILYWCSIAAFSSFAIAYLQAVRGVTDGEAGVMIMLMTGGAFAGQFFWGAACDRFGTHKWMYISVCALQIPLTFAVFFSRGYVLLCALYLMLGFVQSAVPANVDTWILKSFPKTPEIFGPIRSGGSLAYAVFTLIYGRIIDRFGYGVLIFFFSAFALLGALTVLTTPDVRTAPADHSARRAGAKSLLNRKFMLLLFVLLMTGICGSTYQFLAMMIRLTGGSVSSLGVTMFASAILQVPVMFYGSRLSRIPVKVRMLMCCGIYVLMGLFFAFATRPIHVILGSLVSGAGFGILLPAMREWAFSLSTIESRTTAQGMSDAVYVSLGGMVSSGAVGLFADGIGLKPLLLAFVGAQLIGILALALNMRAKRA